MPLNSAIRSTALIALLIPGLGSGLACAEEGQAGIFIVDSEKGTATTFEQNSAVPADAEFRVFASGPKGSTVVIGAFGEDGLHANLLPLAVKQTEASEAVRFPPSDDSIRKTFKTGGKSAELYVVIFPDSHPALESILTELKQIEAAQTKGETDLVMLLSLELKKELANAIRENGAKEYRDGFGDSLADLLKEEPTAKAAVTRTGTGIEDPAAEVIAAKPAEKTLEELEKSWRDDSVVLPIGLVAPGGLVRTITPTP